MTPLEKIQSMKMPFAELKGVTFTEAGADRVVAKMLVRPDLCTLRNTIHCHQPARGRQGHHHDREQDQLHRRRQGRLYGDRDRNPGASGTANPGLADAAGDRGRQAGGGRNPDPDGALIGLPMPNH